MFSTVVLFNSLARQREEVVCVHVTATQVSIQSVNDDGQKEEIDQQIAPVLVLKDNKIASEKDKYEVSARVWVLNVYVIIFIKRIHQSFTSVTRKSVKIRLKYELTKNLLPCIGHFW